jgi:hypothetical protein
MFPQEQTIYLIISKSEILLTLDLIEPRLTFPLLRCSCMTQWHEKNRKINFEVLYYLLWLNNLIGRDCFACAQGLPLPVHWASHKPSMYCLWGIFTLEAARVRGWWFLDLNLILCCVPPLGFESFGLEKWLQGSNTIRHTWIEHSKINNNTNIIMVGRRSLIKSRGPRNEYSYSASTHYKTHSSNTSRLTKLCS